MSDITQRVAGKVVLANDQGQVLILRESGAHKTNVQVGRYILPGGKVEVGEAFFEGLRREVQEETSLKIEIGRPLLVGEWRPVVLGSQQQIIGIFMSATIASGTLTLSEENDAFLWIDPKRRKQYDIAPPDCDAIDAYVGIY